MLCDVCNKDFELYYFCGGKGVKGGGGLCYSAENLAAVGILYDLLLTGVCRVKWDGLGMWRVWVRRGGV